MNLIEIQLDSIRQSFNFIRSFKIRQKGVSSVPVREFTEYELAVIGYYERFGYVQRQDRAIIEDYQTLAVPERDRKDTRELEREFYSRFDEPEFRNDPEYPFQDFNYGP